MHLTANLKQPSWQQNTDQLTKRIDHLLSLRHDYFLSSFFLGFLKPKLITGLGVLPAPDCFFLFVCLFVGINPEKLYSASCVTVGKKVNPLGVITHGQRQET